jgi:hypothetical protein
MYGQHIDDLNVYLNTTTGMDTPIWTRSGNQGKKWIEAEINIPSGSNLQVSLHAYQLTAGHVG